MADNQKKITDSLRANWVAELMHYIEAQHDCDICQTAAGTFMFPTIDALGDDRWVKISVIIPKEASEENGTDGYSLAKEYDLKAAAAEERARKAKEKADSARAKAAAKAKAE